MKKKNNKSNKIKIEFISINKEGTKDEFFSIDIAEFDNPEDAVAFWNGLPEDKRVTEEEDLPYVTKESEEEEDYL